MRKEDEFIGKFLAIMGMVSKAQSAEQPAAETNTTQRITVDSKEILNLPPTEQRFFDKLSTLPESKISEIKRQLENHVDGATNEQS
jgi:hypothetical protein